MLMSSVKHSLIGAADESSITRAIACIPVAGSDTPVGLASPCRGRPAAPPAGTFVSDHSFNDPSCEAGKEGESLMLS
jgi:hypothetical protein